MRAGRRKPRREVEDESLPDVKKSSRSAAAKAVKHIHIDSYSEESSDEDDKVEFTPSKKQRLSVGARNKKSQLAAKKKSPQGKKKKKQPVKTKVKREEYKSESENESSGSRSSSEDEDDEGKPVVSTEKLYKHRASNKQSAVKHLRTLEEQAVKTEKPEELEIEAITGHREYNDENQFHVRYKGCGSFMNTWESESNLQDCKTLIAEYWVKHGKRVKQRELNKMTKEDEEDQDYEVDEIVAVRFGPDKKRSFKVRWQGFHHNTWVKEEDLNCDSLVKAFMKKHEEDRAAEKEGVYEVLKVLDVSFHRDGTRDFLIRWKYLGKDGDTWEPEDHLDCPALIDKFMKKLEKVKQVTERELRVQRKRTDHYAYVNPKSRQSGRLRGGCRISYEDQQASD